jgi:purine-nucleoside phosphorylase
MLNMSAETMLANVKEAVNAVRARTSTQPVAGLILGSGLGPYADNLESKTVIPFREVPHFPRSTVAGHSGNIVLGLAGGVPVVALQGRVHAYEGYAPAETSFPGRVLCGLGIRSMIVTNAAGGVNIGFRPGDLMLITDHLNLTGSNPLIGANVPEWGVRFPDMSDGYTSELRALAQDVARQRGIPLREGVYAGLSGPSYETPAEIRMLRTLGADAVGMSTIPEVIVANHMGVKVLGISCISNMAAGILPRKLTHQEVMDTTEMVKLQFLSLLDGIIPRLAAIAGAGK